MADRGTTRCPDGRRDRPLGHRSSGPGPGTSGRARSRPCAASARCAFFDEPEIPEALTYVIPKGHGLLRADPPRPHRRGEPAPRDLPVGPGRHLHRGHARGDARVLRLHDQHGQPAPRPPAAHRVGRLQPAHDQVDRGPHRAAWPTTSSTAWPTGAVRLRRRGGGPAPARDHLRHDGHRRRRTTTPCSTRPTSSSPTATPSTCPRATDPMVAFMTAAQQLNLLMPTWPTYRGSTRPTTSPRPWSTPTSTARRSPTPRWPPSSSCSSWRATRRPATPSATGCWP